MRIVVTGAAGFLGSALCRHLVAAGCHIVLGIDNAAAANRSGRLAEIACSPRFTFRQADVCNRRRVRALLDAFDAEAVVHLARDGRAASQDTGNLIRTNVVGTFGLLEAVRDYWSALPEAQRQAFRLLQVSSADVFGARHNQEGCTHDGTYLAETPFAASMAAADQLVTAWHRSFGLPAMIAAPTDVYGPYQSPEKGLARLIIKTIEGETPDERELDASQHCEPLLVDDCVRALQQIVSSGIPGAVYAVGGGSVRSTAALEKRIRDVVERHSSSHRGSTSVDDAWRPGPTAATGEGKASGGKPAALDCSRLRRDTGWKPEETPESGLSRVVRWHLENEGWWRSITEARVEDARHGLAMQA